MSSDRFVGIQVSGLRETIKALQQTPRAVRDAAFKELFAAAGPVVAEAKRLAPRSTKKTGRHLQDSIRAIVRSRGVMVGSTVEHAMIVHFGRKSTQRSRSGNVYTRALSPTPWLYPAFDAKREEVRAGLEVALERALDALWGGAA